jgi:tetratricopeptide (TPR) repeat protein
MSEKKKSTIPKTTETRIGRSPAARAAKIPDTPPAVVASPTGAVAVAQPLDSQKQLQVFEAAMKLFHARRLQEALEQFRQAAEGPELDVAQRARLHAAMCERRLQRASVNLTSAEDYYNYGIALINTRRLAEARAHLEKGLEIAPQADHIHYALALAQALSGELAGAYEHLHRAIELDARNRIIARQDADFAPLANQAPFDGLLYPEKKTW